MSLQPGTRLGNYEVLSELGSGGMGEVYKAKDLKLGRDVAIKVLPQEMASDASRLRRFEQEARAASALNHPNIVTIYEIGEHEGTPFIAMEYVNGKTLREILADGPLPNDKLIRYATQLAEGLAKAHQAGIVHRDLKPENIIISEDGFIKILDFGLAKLLPEGDVGAEVSTLARETIPGTILGTVGYMSPEQAKGESADFRSDQFSFGAIVYEMATGKRGFERETAAETLTAIIREEPELVTLVNPKVAATTARVIDRCLSKDPKERYNSTGDIAKDLPWEEPTRRHQRAAVWAGGAMAIILLMILAFIIPDAREWVLGESQGPKIDSIAVLPLENLSGDPEQEYFADGMTDELIAELAQIGALKVISRTSIMQYKGARKPLPEIARELNVDAVVAGTVRRSEGRVRVTAQLIEASTDQHLWAESFERDLTNVLALQSEIAQAIAQEIRVTLTPQEAERFAAKRPTDPEAYEAYLKARYHLNQATPDGIQRSIEFFREAIAEDPDYALAHADLAGTFATAAFYSVATAGEDGPEARAAAERALELDDSLAEAHSALGAVKLFVDFDWDGARREFERAIQLKPSYALGYLYYAWSLEAVGRHDEAIAAILRAEELDPLSPLISVNVGWRYFNARRYDEAIEQIDDLLKRDPRAVAVQPGNNPVYLALAHLGRFDEAIARLKEKLAQNGLAETSSRLLALLYALADREEARHMLESGLDTGNPTLAVTYALLGDLDTAMDLIEEAHQQRAIVLIYADVGPMYDPLRSDPRFQDLLRRMNFPE